MEKTFCQIAKHYKKIKQQIYVAATKRGRNTNPCTLVAVSKQQTDERIADLWQAGHRCFGENKVDEAERHWQQTRATNQSFSLHLIGHLQSNKVKRAVALFDVIETLDSVNLAKKLQREIDVSGRKVRVFVQVNTGEEPQKYGVLPGDLSAFLLQVHQETNLEVIGLMCIPPQGDAPGLHFALLAKLAALHNIPQLSMGMSSDFETAISFGATSVRIGSALFGKRAV